MYKIEQCQDRLILLEKLIGLSVGLHNLNAGVQRRYDLSIVQWLVLKKIVDQPGLSAGSMADISQVHPSTLTPTIARLESLGLIYVLERPSDHRRKLLVASWRGLEWARRSEGALVSALDASLAKTSSGEAEVDMVRALTTNLIDRISKNFSFAQA